MQHSIEARAKYMLIYGVFCQWALVSGAKCVHFWTAPPTTTVHSDVQIYHYILPMVAKKDFPRKGSSQVSTSSAPGLLCIPSFKHFSEGVTPRINETTTLAHSLLLT